MHASATSSFKPSVDSESGHSNEVINQVYYVSNLLMHLGDPVSWHFRSSCRDVHVWLRASVTPNFNHPFFVMAVRFNLQPFYCIARAFEHTSFVTQYSFRRFSTV